MLNMLSTMVDIRAFTHLTRENWISQEDLDAAFAEVSRGPVDLETLLIEKYRVPQEHLGKSLSDFYRCPYVQYSERRLIDHELLKNLNLDYLKRNYWIPLKRDQNVIEVLIDDPHDLDKALDIRRAFPGLTIRLAVGLRRDIVQFLLAASDQADGWSISKILDELVNEARLDVQRQARVAQVTEDVWAIVRLANQMITDAYVCGLLDIV